LIERKDVLTQFKDFEVIDLSFVRSPSYTSYFEALDKTGGFFYERWGDAPVRSIAASMMLSKDEIWNVDHAGYVSGASKEVGPRDIVESLNFACCSFILHTATALEKWILVKVVLATHIKILVSGDIIPRH
jgi:hypothetical protein